MATKTRKELPWQISTLIAQMGGMGLRGAFVYMGASQFVYNLTRNGQPDPEAEKGLVEINRETGTVKFEVGLSFNVNIGEDKHNLWKMIVAVDTNDTYTVILWKPVHHVEGKIGEIMEVKKDIYFDVLQETCERMYDEAIKTHQDGFIHI